MSPFLVSSVTAHNKTAVQCERRRGSSLTTLWHKVDVTARLTDQILNRDASRDAKGTWTNRLDGLRVQSEVVAR